MSEMHKCPICGYKVETKLATQLRRGQGEVYHCQTCDHGFLGKSFSQDPKHYYAETYRQEYSHNSATSATNAQELFDVYKNYQSERLRFVSPFLTNETHILEVGASSGQFLVHVKDKVSVTNAIELDSACCMFMRENLGVCADDEFLEKSLFANKTYDVVCAFQVMEHVEDPKVFLEGLSKVTNPNGYIFIEVPNILDPLLSVWNIPEYQKFYFHSAHLHYFSVKSLKLVASAAGFTAEKMDIFPTQDYNILNHLHWIMSNGPQSDCHIGLGEILFNGKDLEISEWLTEEIRELNIKYISKLINKNKTSNLMMRLKKIE